MKNLLKVNPGYETKDGNDGYTYFVFQNEIACYEWKVSKGMETLIQYCCGGFLNSVRAIDVMRHNKA